LSTALSFRAPLRRAVLASAAALTLAGIVASCAPTAQPPTDPRTIARNMLVDYGWGNNTQFNCLNSLWMRESNWEWSAKNPYSGAYGIPQSLPASKMAAAGADWRTNPATQIRWGLDYIKGRYGSPCGAWSHELAIGWYARSS
jgi:hypothetical protein